MGGFSIVLSESLPEGIDVPITFPLYIHYISIIYPNIFPLYSLDIPLNPNKLNNMEK